jgi:hypothetical protein
VLIIPVFITLARGPIFRANYTAQTALANAGLATGPMLFSRQELRIMQLMVTTRPPRTLRVDSQVIGRILRDYLQAEVYNDGFLMRCGIRVDLAMDRLEIRFVPNTGLRVNEQAVLHILEHRLIHRVSQDAFLDKCNIRLAVKEEE